MNSVLSTARSKIALSIALSNALVLLCVCSGTLLYQHHTFKKERHSFLTHQVRLIARKVQTSIANKDSDSVAHLLEALKLDKDITSLVIKDANGDTVADMHQPRNLEHGDQSLDSSVVRVRHALYHPTSSEPLGSVEMTSYHPRAEYVVGEIAIAAGAAILIAGLVTCILMRRFRSSLTQPVLRVVDQTRAALAANSLEVSLTKDSENREVTDLQESIESMFSELREKDRLLAQAQAVVTQHDGEALQKAREENSAFKREIESKNQELLSLISHAPASVALLDDQLRYVVCSKKWSAEYGLPNEYVGKKHEEIALNTPVSWTATYSTVLSGTICSSTEDSYLTESGTKKFLRWTMQPWRPLKSTIGGLVITTEDITDILESRDNALQLAKIRSEFLANITHELRTPLNGIIGFSAILEETPCSNEQREYIELIRSSSEVLLHVINDVLDFSKIEQRAVNLEQIQFSPHVLMQRISSLFSHSAESKGLSLLCTVDPTVPNQVVGDEFRLQQVLTNLVGNAIKFTGTGSITLGLAKTISPAGTERLCSSVSDTGIGIETKQIEQIFKPFKQADGSVTRKYGGTGLGLSIASELVELMGGKLTVDSVINQGSKFHFTVDLAPASDSSEVRKSVKTEDPTSQPLVVSKRILVAEDNLINQKLIHKILDKAGYSVEVVENGQESVEKFVAESFDLIILDLQMPVLSGIDAAKKIRQLEGDKESHIPLVALTAHAFEEDRRKCEAAGFDRYLTKPIDRVALLQTVATLIK